MLTVEVWCGEQRSRKTCPDERRITIGRAAKADLHLSDDFVSDEHAVLLEDGGGWFLEALGTNPTWLNGESVSQGARVAVADGSVIAIRGFKLHLVRDAAAARDPAHLAVEELAENERQIYETTFARIPFKRVGLLPDKVTKEALEILRAAFEPAFEEKGSRILENPGLSILILQRLFFRLLLRRSAADGGGAGIESERLEERHLPLSVVLRDPEVSRLLRILAERVEEVRSSQPQPRGASEVALRARESLAEIIDRNLGLQKRTELIREEVFRRVSNLAFGLGPLEDLLDIPDATEVLIVGPERIYVELGGRLRRTHDRFPSAETTRRIVERAVSRAGRRIDISQPLVDVQLDDGSRMNVIIPPLSRSGDVLSIRRFRRTPFTLADLARVGTFDERVERFLAAAVQSRRNIVVSGGTGAGKTTLLSALIAQAGPEERIVVIEETSEIRLPKETMHVVMLQSRPPNIEGKGEVTIRQLVRNALRMRPDRIVVGECRGPEVIEMLQAMNTGHPGSCTTLHANSAGELVGRMEFLALGGEQLPLEAVRRLIGSTIDLVVHVGRVEGVGRRLLEVAEVVGFDEKRQAVDIAPVFRWHLDGDREMFRFTGWLPGFTDEIEATNCFAIEDFYDG